ncbi:MAG: FAD-binding protein, partial [Planctomycetia bacterium]|nr:FAD-binding protein [Planctomycetia bacterium]
MKREALARHLRQAIRGEVRFDDVSRKLYSTDASIYRVQPLGVVVAKSVEDLAATVQICGEMHVPITARGGGTSLSGQSIGPGVVVDCSKYLNHLLDLDVANRTARVQPGIVLDQLNREAGRHGLQFGPEVATSSRANLGGMIGNNSAGARSIVYGKTSDHVRRLGVVLADGSRADFGPISAHEWERRAQGKSLEAGIYRGVRQVVRTHDAEIQKRFPKILRRVSGYNLDYLAANPEAGLHSLIIGSEGTLGLIAEAELKLIPKPKYRGLLVPHFESLAAAMDALAVCLEFQPSAVELLDKMLIDLARDNLATQRQMAAVVGRPAALLMVEFSGDEEAEIANRVEKLKHRLGEAAGVTALVPAIDADIREPLWNLRRAAMPLLYGMHGDRKPVTFVEDCAVSPERLPEFVARFRELLQSNETDGAFYGHASVGCLHIRPVLNLKDQREVWLMRRIAEQVTDLVLEFGGSFSGEHGDGLARSEWNRKMFGPVVYEAFRQVKRTFDPENLLNPGKVVDAPAMTENLRYGPDYHPRTPLTVFDYSKQEGMVRAVELCNGNGACRKMQGGTMCPSFRATCDEKDSTRGRANALRLALSGQDPVRDFRSAWVHDVLDLCLMCKACKAECPSNVDMAKLKAEFLEAYYEHRPRPLGQTLMTRIHWLNQMASRSARFVNWLQQRRLIRWLMEKTAGIDRRRSLPEVHADHLRAWFARRKPAETARRFSKVLLLDDCFSTFNEPHIGRAAVEVLEHAGCQVELAGIVCCARPMISKGFLRQARDLIRQQAPSLAQRLADGAPILGLEPSCLLTLADEWPELVPGNDTRRIAAAAELTDVWLAKQRQAGKCELPLQARAETCVLHGHCHQKALQGTAGTAAALQLVPDLRVNVLDTGCCGMAGSFGYEKEHYDLSVQIARLSVVPALNAAPDALVVAPGTSCRHQIKDLTGRRALHPVE